MAQPEPAAPPIPRAGSGRVKICGISDEAGLEAAVAAGADWIGFVLHPASRRAVTPERAAELARRLPPGIASVALLVGARTDAIARALDAHTFAALQLYDDPEHVAAARARFGCETWLALPVADVARVPAPDVAADLVLIEAAAPAGSASPGGHGGRLDWAALGARMARPEVAGLRWMLAGGLDPDNVGRAIRLSGARAVDVSSGVESAPGRKDPARIAAFVRAARDAFALVPDAQSGAR